MSTIRADTIEDAAGTGPVTLTDQHASKVYARTAGAGTSITEGFNTSSVTDHGTGDHTINYTNNMSSVNYAWGGNAHSEGVTSGNFMQVLNANTPTASAIRLSTSTFQGGIVDPNSHSLIVHGDLA
jgi:hypothetical protein